MYQHFIGIDISKHDFVVGILNKPKVACYPNNEAGFSQFYHDTAKLLASGLVILETTGGHELALIHYLQAKQCAIHRANTRKVKHFIRSYGKLAKTDAIDALALAQYGKERHVNLELFKPNLQQELLKHVQRRLELKKMLTQEKNRRQAPDMRLLTSSFDTIIAALEGEIKKVDDCIKQLVTKDPSLTKKAGILKTINGIGDIIAVELLALMPELGQINRRQIASLAGLAPHPNQSGTKQGYQRTKGGRSEVKSILFMAAMSAARSQSRLGEFYSKLLANGKKKMVALTALMRKILVIANAKLKEYLNESAPLQHG